MCMSVCILVSFIVLLYIYCFSFFTYTVYLSVCMSAVYVYGPCCLIALDCTTVGIHLYGVMLSLTCL